MLNGADGMAEFYSPAPQKIKAVVPRAALQQVMEKLPEVFDDAAWLEVTLLKDVGGILELAVEDQLQHRVFVAEGLFDEMSAFVWDNAPQFLFAARPVGRYKNPFPVLEHEIRSRVALDPLRKIRHLYEDEKLTIAEVGKRVDLSHDTVAKYLGEIGGQFREPGIPRVDLDLEVARRLYLQDKLSLEAIGERFGTTGGTIYWKFKKAGIPIRSRAPSYDKNIAKIRHLYEVEKRSMNEVAKIMGQKPETIARYHRRAGVEIRLDTRQLNRRK